MAHHRHKRETDARRFTSRTGSRAAQWAAGAAVLATAPRRGAGRADRRHRRDARRRSSPPSRPRSGSTPAATTERPSPGPSTAPPARAFQRGHGRPAGAPPRAVKQAHVQKWTTTDLNLWSAPRRPPVRSALVKSGKHVLITGRAQDGRVELVVDGQSRWVTAGYLADSKPDAASGVTAAAGLSMAPCPDGSVEYRLTPGGGLRLPLGVPRLPADHVVRRVGRPRRARDRQGARHHDQRRRPGQRDRGVPPAARRRAAPLRHPLAAADLDAGPRLRGLAAASPTAAHRRPTTWTTCTSRSTERGSACRADAH